MKTPDPTPKNPLDVALEQLKQRGIKRVVTALYNATDKMLVPSQIHGLRAGLGSRKVTVPKPETIALIDKGLQRLGLKGGLPPEAWEPFTRAVKAQRSTTDKRRKDVRAREGLPPLAEVRGKSGGAAAA